MYVCLCKGITDTALRNAARQQPGRDARAICRELGAGMDCGRCARTALGVVHEAQRQELLRQEARPLGVVQVFPVAC